MRNLALFFLTLLIFSCDKKAQKEVSSVNPINWNNRTVVLSPKDSLANGSSYLSVYSQIYSETEHRTHNLTGTISMRNTNLKDSIFIRKAEYFDTHGNSIRTYFDKPIFIKPMETVEIVIDEKDQSGGTGANFLFHWSIKPTSHEPYFEGVMISTSGQQGLSFTTKGIRVE
ncbi:MULTISPECIES: DUF3124 domain-containing protein [Flavobacteriaceae]|jgi:hypothetical protein|uniref:DUF3124 domain-containing protein n=1 Tax=Flagellimonas alvinocaridis TaxID=2530200 RepID=A0A4S8RTY4_9FLAO|nr:MULTISPECIES: DUF3124 domain-containing protein [Allomuricauda]MDC6362347.1 DUF3124 domain-containing protein [Muricauda sp. SP22]THV61492.1 DUF3124 domain-containing protein [Allomuricauda alvinocaridis]